MHIIIIIVCMCVCVSLVVSIVYNGSHNDFFFLLCRGEEFRKEYSRLGEVRSILPQNVHVMALTATATKVIRSNVCEVLGMESPVLVSISPNKDNIKYIVATRVDR